MVTETPKTQRNVVAETAADRALAALQGLALGDALGMPTQSMSPREISDAYGQITGLRDAVATQPIAPGMPAGSVTDDTEQALLLAGLLLSGRGHIDSRAYADTLLAWEDDMRARGSLDLLGPSTKAALEQVRAGADPNETGRYGTTNGAAMRVTPVGIAYSLADREAFAAAVHESCVVTHDTRQGWEGAALVAAAVSAGIDGADVPEAIDTALDVVASLPGYGWWAPNASVVARAQVMLHASSTLHGAELADFLRDVVGTSVESTEAIPAALVLAREYAGAPLEGLCRAAELGGDTDTIGAMAGAILGAGTGTGGLPADEVSAVVAQSELDLLSIRDGLLALRKVGVR